MAPAPTARMSCPAQTVSRSFARRAAALADTDERMIRELIGLLDRIGDRAGAVDAYASFTKRLSRELDVAPSAETQLLLDQVRSRDCADPSVNDVDAHELPPQRTVVVGERRAVRQRLRHLTIPLIATAIAGTLLAKSLAPWRGRTSTAPGATWR